MNLYITADGRYVGTQVEAKKAGKGWTPETVPTDKEGLIAYLNGHNERTCARLEKFDQVDRELAILSDLPNPFADPEPAPPPAPRVASTSFEATEIEDFILNEASVAQCENIFSTLGSRFSELAKVKPTNLDELPDVMPCPEARDSHSGCPTCGGKWYVRVSS